MPGEWSEKELFYLKQQWRKFDDKQLSAKLHRSRQAIKGKRLELGLFRNPDRPTKDPVLREEEIGNKNVHEVVTKLILQEARESRRKQEEMRARFPRLQRGQNVKIKVKTGATSVNYDPDTINYITGIVHDATPRMVTILTNSGYRETFVFADFASGLAEVVG
jgi:hypothetical protein